MTAVPNPEPAAGEVLVRVRACGICGSDLHRYRDAAAGNAVIPGHEIAGEVAAVGAGVSGWDIGTRVAVEPLVVCRDCAFCRRGDYQICRSRILLGAGQHGGLAELVRAPAAGLFRLPDDLDWPVAALAEPMAVAVHGVRLAEVAPADQVLVQGAGAIGLLTVLAARAGGARVAVSARYPHQAEAATRFGADAVFLADAAGEDAVAQFAHEVPVDVVIETVGGESDTLLQAPVLARPGGRVCVLGVFLQPPRINALALVLREIRMVGAITYGRSYDGADFDQALRLLAQHRELVRSLITHTFPLDRIELAFATADDKLSRAVKVTVLP